MMKIWQTCWPTCQFFFSDKETGWSARLRLKPSISRVCCFNPERFPPFTQYAMGPHAKPFFLRLSKELLAPKLFRTHLNASKKSVSQSYNERLSYKNIQELILNKCKAKLRKSLRSNTLQYSLTRCTMYVRTQLFLFQIFEAKWKIKNINKSP